MPELPFVKLEAAVSTDTKSHPRNRPKKSRSLVPVRLPQQPWMYSPHFCTGRQDFRPLYIWLSWLTKNTNSGPESHTANLFQAIPLNDLVITPYLA